MNIKGFVIGFAAILASFTATSGGLVHGMAKFGPWGETVPYVEIHTLQADSESELVSKAATWMRNYTSGSGHEVCANICRSASTSAFAGILTTSHSQIGCALNGDRCPDGFVAVGKTIHSHPFEAALEINAQDRLFLQARTPGKHVPQRMRMRPDARKFSDIDYASGAGYLVTQNTIMYQEGQGTERQIQ